MNTYNVELTETRRFVVILEADSREQAQELAKDGQTGEPLPLGIDRVEVLRVRLAQQPRGGGNG